MHPVAQPVAQPRNETAGHLSQAPSRATASTLQWRIHGGAGAMGRSPPPPEGLGKFFLLLLMQIHSVLHFETRRLTNVKACLFSLLTV
jgi:hypothetical protein